MINVAQHLQIVTGASPTTSGLLLTPLVAGIVATAMGSGILITKTGRYKIFPITGTVVVAVGLYLLSRLGVHTSRLSSSLDMVVLGLGIGLIMQVMVLVVQNAVAPGDLGAATSTVNLSRQIGSSVGVALIGALFIHRLTSQLTVLLPGFAHTGSRVASITPQDLAHFPPPVRQAIELAFAQALPPIYAYLIPLAGAAFVLALILPEIPLRTRAHATSPAPQQRQPPQTR